MIYIDNQTKLKIPKKRLKEIAKSLTNKDLELIICDNDYIQELNLNFRQLDKPTDVLSFPLSNEIGIQTIGTIVISKDFVKSGAIQFGHKKSEETTLLFIHGILHLLGFDHETDNGEMRKEEKRLIKKFDLSKSLIVRVQS